MPANERHGDVASTFMKQSKNAGKIIGAIAKQCGGGKSDHAQAGGKKS